MRSLSITAANVIAWLALPAFVGCAGGGSATAPSTMPQTAVSSSRQAAAQSVVRSTAAVTQLYYDNFETGSTTGWTSLEGSTWSICQPPGQSHEFCAAARPNADALATAGSAAWTNYEVDAWAASGSTAVGGVELAGRFVDANHYYQLELRTLAGGQTWGISKVSNGTWTQLKEGAFPYGTGGYHLRLVLNGSTLTAYATTKPNDRSLLSDKLLGTVSDATYASGAVAVRAIGGIPARFDEVKVTTLASPAPIATQPPAANSALSVPNGFYAEAIATVTGARELSAASNGDLIVGTHFTTIAIVPNAESDGVADPPQTLVKLPEGPAEGVALGPSGTLFAATEHGVWAIPYKPGMLTAPSAKKIAAIRTGPVSPGTDGDNHWSSSVIRSGQTLYVGAGSSCNACVEVDPTRASVQAMNLDGSGMHTYATRIRNPVAFTTNPQTGTVFTGGAGQDDLPAGHPYEYLDALTSHPAGADYGWPVCEEDHVAYSTGADCSRTVAPIIEFPAYSTLIGAAYYPASTTGTYAFPAPFHDGIFVSMHGSWHAIGGVPIDPPHVAFVPMNGDIPAKRVDWANPNAQWIDFFKGFQDASGARIGRTTGLAVGPRGSLFVADDQTGTIFRIRPGIRP